MNKKRDIEVIIMNKRITLSGYESEEYMQRIASYINDKYEEYKDSESYKQLDAEMKNILVQINLADDYYKALDKIKELKIMNDSKSEELYEIKHEVISAQTELERAKLEIESLQKELNSAQKSIFQLESKLKQK